MSEQAQPSPDLEPVRKLVEELTPTPKIGCVLCGATGKLKMRREDGDGIMFAEIGDPCPCLDMVYAVGVRGQTVTEALPALRLLLAEVERMRSVLFLTDGERDEWRRKAENLQADLEHEWKEIEGWVERNRILQGELDRLRQGLADRGRLQEELQRGRDALASGELDKLRVENGRLRDQVANQEKLRVENEKLDFSHREHSGARLVALQEENATLVERIEHLEAQPMAKPWTMDEIRRLS